MAICENLAHRLHAIRTERGMTITEFSELLGIARSSLQQILSGRGNPRMDTVEHIARRLEMDPLSLLSDCPGSPPISQDGKLHQLLELLTTQLEDRHE